MDALAKDCSVDLPLLAHRLRISALDHSAHGVVVFSAAPPRFRIVYANQAASRMAGVTGDDLLGQDFPHLPFVAGGASAAEIGAALAEQRRLGTVVCQRRPDGTLLSSQLLLAPLRDRNGVVKYFAAIQAQVAPNHVSMIHAGGQLLQQLDAAICAAALNGKGASLVVFDIDRFKQVNHLLGYEGGDALLDAFADRVSRVSNGKAHVLHYGVDEFALIYDETGDKDALMRHCRDLVQAVTLPFQIASQQIELSVSVGIARYPDDAENAESLLRHAHLALLHAKDSGGGATHFFSPELLHDFDTRRRIETSLRQAIANNNLRLHYQPIVDLQTGGIAGLEALVRWTDDVLGPVSPALFIPIAEQSGLIDDLGWWVIRQACNDMRTWRDAGVAPARVAVNISPRQFLHGQLVDEVSDILAENDIPPNLLLFEITETVLMLDTPLVDATIKRLASMGIDIILDDFGTGYSSLAYLKRYHFAKVKIDRSFIENVSTDRENAAIANAIIAMAHSMGIRVVAEGVETEQQCEFLRRHMCDEIQGYLFGTALPPDAISQILVAGIQVPEHLQRDKTPTRTLLLVDDEPNILSALKRLFRRDGYEVLTANGGQEGLDILASRKVDVILSDQRMPGMTGVEFLSQAREIQPDTVRMVLSGYTELQTVTDAVNRGAIYKFLTKPWEDEQLRGHIAEAFQRKEMSDENERLNLQVRTANFELAVANRKLEALLQEREQRITDDEITLGIVHEVLQRVPVPVLGLDEDGVIAFVNCAARQLFHAREPLLGMNAGTALPEAFAAVHALGDGQSAVVRLDDCAYRATIHFMGRESQSRGTLISFTNM